MNTHGWVGLSLAAAAALVVATSCAPQAERGATAASGDPLEAGWRFACAITNDAKDRAACQEKVALAYLARGDCDTALKLGAQIGPWRQGVVLAEAAATLAEGGQTNAALERAAQAEAIARGIQDWQRDLIQARVVKAKALLLGNEEEAGRWSGFYKSNRDYRGEVAAYQALALARGGRLTNALEVLDGLADTTHLDVTSWRANGYLLLAKAGHLDTAQSSNALGQAWAASERISGWKGVVVQMGLVETAADLGQKELARAWLTGISSNLLAEAESGRGHASGLGRLAVCWAGLRDGERVAECARAAEPLIRQLQTIEQPALFAMQGEAWARLGDVQKALTSYEQALELAGQLTNPRPRAIACVEICLSLERARLRLKPVSEGLNRLLAGFGATHG
jgi:tetratricopeptide (TPR) repeat protein